jgi:hypothetical protein
LGSARSAKWFNGRLWVAADHGGVQIFVPDGDKNLRFLGVITTPGVAWDVTAINQYVMVADGKRGVEILGMECLPRLATPKALNPPGLAQGLAVKDGRILVAGGRAGLQILANAPDRLRLVYAVDTPGKAVDVVVGGEQVFVADGLGGLHAVVLGRDRGRIADTIRLEGNLKRVVYHQQKIYVAGLSGNLHIIDAKPAEKMKLLGSLSVPKPLLDIAVKDGYAYLSCGTSGTFVADIRQPNQAMIVGKIEVPDYLQPFACSTSLSVAGQQLYVANGRAGIQVYDLTRADAPLMVGSLSTFGNAVALVVSGEQVYVDDLRSGLQMVNCQDPDRLLMVGALGVNIKAKGMVVIGDELFATTNMGGVVAVPLPFKVPRIERHSSERLDLYIPPLTKTGYYSLSLSDGQKNLVLPNVVFSK